MKSFSLAVALLLLLPSVQGGPPFPFGNIDQHEFLTGHVPFGIKLTFSTPTNHTEWYFDRFIEATVELTSESIVFETDEVSVFTVRFRVWYPSIVIVGFEFWFMDAGEWSLYRIEAMPVVFFEIHFLVTTRPTPLILTEQEILWEATKPILLALLTGILGFLIGYMLLKPKKKMRMESRERMSSL